MKLINSSPSGGIHTGLEFSASLHHFVTSSLMLNLHSSLPSSPLCYLGLLPVSKRNHFLVSVAEASARRGHDQFLGCRSPDPFNVEHLRWGRALLPCFKLGSNHRDDSPLLTRLSIKDLPLTCAQPHPKPKPASSLPPPPLL